MGATPVAGSQPSARESRDWALFTDWCESMGVVPLPSPPEAISDFLAALPAPIEAQGRRVRAIRRAHERAHVPFELPDSQATALRAGAQWASVSRALAQVPKYHHPKGFQEAVRGRRDGWLMVLVGTLGLTRNEARMLAQEEIELFPQLCIKGRPVLRDGSPDECPKCAVTRWLRIAGAASFGFWNEVKETVSPVGVDPGAHDCATGLDGVWRQANTLLPAVDRHGWVTADPMSARSVSATMAARQTLGPVAELTVYPSRPPVTGRFADATMNELADAYSDVDERAAAVMLRIKELDEMLAEL